MINSFHFTVLLKKSDFSGMQEGIVILPTNKEKFSSFYQFKNAVKMSKFTSYHRLGRKNIISYPFAFLLDLSEI